MFKSTVSFKNFLLVFFPVLENPLNCSKILGLPCSVFLSQLKLFSEIYPIVIFSFPGFLGSPGSVTCLVQVDFQGNPMDDQDHHRMCILVFHRWNLLYTDIEFLLLCSPSCSKSFFVTFLANKPIRRGLSSTFTHVWSLFAFSAMAT